jgi:hypothetical protein
MRTTWFRVGVRGRVRGRVRVRMRVRARVRVRVGGRVAPQSRDGRRLEATWLGFRLGFGL